MDWYFPISWVSTEIIILIYVWISDYPKLFPCNHWSPKFNLKTIEGDWRDQLLPEYMVTNLKGIQLENSTEVNMVSILLSCIISD